MYAFYMDPEGCRLDCLPSNGTYIYFKVHVVSTAAWGTLLLLSKGEDRQCGAVRYLLLDFVYSRRLKEE